MEVKLVVLKFVKDLDEGQVIRSIWKGKRGNILAVLIAMYFFNAKFNFPLRLCESAASRRKSRDCIFWRSIAGLGASFCCRDRVKKKKEERKLES